MIVKNDSGHQIFIAVELGCCSQKVAKQFSLAIT